MANGQHNQSYLYWWGLWEGLGWLEKKLDRIKHAMQHNMDEQKT
jgi:hypothetical protein